MKVCIVSDVFPPDIGGIQKYAYDFAKYLSKQKNITRVTVVTFSDDADSKNIINEKLEIIRVKKGNFFMRGLSIFNRLFKKREYDVFHSITLLSSGFFTSIFNKFYLKKKCFVTVFGLDALFGFRNYKLRILIKIVFNTVNKIICFSDSTKYKVMETYRLPKNKFVTIYPGISMPKIEDNKLGGLRKKLDIKNDDFVVMFVGRLVERKGTDDLIRAVSGIDDKRVKLLIIGDGPEKEKLKILASKLAIKERTIFVGAINYKDIFNYYGLADIFCMPSRYLSKTGDIEGLGIVFLEAQFCGKPVIGTNSGGIPEAIKEDKSGFVVNEGDYLAIKKKIIILKKNKKRFMKMSKNSKNFVKKNFDWKKCVEEHIRLYSS